MSEAKTKKETAPEQAAPAQAAETPAQAGEELVSVRQFKDNDKYNSDVFVSVNCNNYLIRRGETVMVPLFIKKELDRAELQRKRAEYYRDEGWKQSLIVQEGK